MYAAFCTLENIENVLKKVNEKYNDNIIFAPSSKLKLCVFTLQCKNPSGEGAWLEDPKSYATTKNPTDRVMRACYHVYKDFSEILFALNPAFTIFDRGTRIAIDEPLEERSEWCYCAKKEYEKEIKEKAEQA